MGGGGDGRWGGKGEGVTSRMSDMNGKDESKNPGRRPGFLSQTAACVCAYMRTSSVRA